MKPLYFFLIGVLLLGVFLLLAWTPSTFPTTEETIEKKSLEILRTLKNKNFETLSQVAHPEKGIRFSPYGTLVESDKIFSQDHAKKLLQDSTIYEFGFYDGSGFAIQKTFSQYFEEFVYDVDFLIAPKKSFDKRLGQGNTLNNIFDVYPKAHFMEFHFPGFDPQYDGMDWKSLRLIFEEKNGMWYLISIMHDQWTI